MKLWCELATPTAVALAACACAPLTDDVFTPLALGSRSPVTVDEGAGVVKIPLKLGQPRDHALSLRYRLIGIDAQDDCQAPDFGAADGTIEWAAGSLEAHVSVWIADDELAERDERLELRLEAEDRPSMTPLARVEIVIADDDRSALLDARELGVLPDVAGDQSTALQAALDRAAKLGQAVLIMAPGDYEISRVELGAGTTLSAYDVRWHRPAQSAANIVSLRLAHEGAEASRPSLVEGLTIDGQREEQGAYREHEREAAHLVTVAGDSERGGARRASFERLVLLSGTGSGLFLGPDSEVTVCGLRASELWRDALTLNGGAARLRLRNLDATATHGTGLWLGAHVPGFGDSYRIDVEAEDLSIGAGDVEIEASDSSRVTLRRLMMTQPPVRLDAPGGSVRIEDSVLVLGQASVRSPWGAAHDVEITRTSLLASAVADADETPLAFAAVSLTAPSLARGPVAAGKGWLRFRDCRFELTGIVGSRDAVHAIENTDVDTSVVVSSSTLGAGFADWFGPVCSGCVLSP